MDPSLATMKERFAALFSVDKDKEMSTPAQSPRLTSPPSNVPSLTASQPQPLLHLHSHSHAHAQPLSHSATIPATLSMPVVQSVVATNGSELDVVNTWLSAFRSNDDSRVALARRLTQQLHEMRLREADSVLRLWSVVRELLHARTEEREAGMALLLALLRAGTREDDALDALRSDVVGTLEELRGHDQSRVDMLALVTHGGKRLPVALSERVFALVADWLSAASPALQPLLALVVALVKHNTALVAEDSLARIVQRVCMLADEARDEAVLGQSLRVLDAAVRYARIPAVCRDAFVTTLCRAVNVEKFSDLSWAVLHNHLQDRAGVAIVQRLCALLDDATLHVHVPLLRGAVFFLSMALWGSQRVASLDVAPSTVLPSLARVLACRQVIVAYEVALVLRRLVKKRGLTLQVEWHLVGRLLALFRPYVNGTSSDAAGGLVSVLGEVLDVLEEKYTAKAFVGMGIKGTLIAALEAFVAVRPEKHSFFLLRVYLDDIAPEHEAWLASLRTMLTTYFVREQRPAIRLRALDATRMLFDRYAHFYAAELAECAVLSFLPTIYLDPEPSVRDEGLRLVVHVARIVRESKTFVELSQILANAVSAPGVQSETQLAAVAGLVTVLQEKFAHPRFEHTLLVLEHLRSMCSHEDVAVRRAVLGVLLQLRVNARGHLQLANQTSLYVRVGTRAKGHEQVGLFDMQRFVDDLVARLTREDRLELLTALLRGLQQFALNYFSFRAVNSRTIVSDLCDLLVRRAIGASAHLTHEQQRETEHLTYELLAVLLPYALEQSGNIGSALASRVMTTLLSGLQFDDAVAPVHRTCLSAITLCLGLARPAVLEHSTTILTRLHDMARASSRSPAQASFVVSFLCFLTEEHPTIAMQLDATEVSLAFSALLVFIDRNRCSAAIVAQAYRAMTQLFLLQPLPARPSHLELLQPPLRAHVAHNQCALAEVELDILARSSWTDVEPEPPLASKRADEASVLFTSSVPSQLYVYGNATLIEVSSGRLGWARVKVRRATGTLVWAMQLQNATRAPARTRVSSATTAADKDVREEIMANLLRSTQHVRSRASSDIVPLSPPVSPQAPFPAVPHDSDDSPSIMQSPSNDQRRGSVDFRSLAAFSVTPSASVDLAKLLPIPVDLLEGESPSSVIEEQVSRLAQFYPPLPSYEEEPAPFSNNPELLRFTPEDGAFITDGKLSVEGQMLLHSKSHLADNGLLLKPMLRYSGEFKDTQTFDVAQSEDTASKPDLDKLLPQISSEPHVVQGDGSGISHPLSSLVSVQQSNTSVESILRTTPNSSPLRNIAQPSPVRSTSPKIVERLPSPRHQHQHSSSGNTISTTSATSEGRSFVRSFAAPLASDSGRPSLLRSSVPPRPTQQKISPSRLSDSQLVTKKGIPGHDDLVDVLHPAFVFSQLHLLSFEPGSSFIHLENTESLLRSLSILDRMLSVETHKLGVLYVRPGQTSQSEILSNAGGSPHYLKFLASLGKIVRLNELADGTYTAGLDKSNDALDGEYSVMWTNDTTQVMFHVASMMPTLTSDSACTAKKRHVGNDYVHIVFDESGSLNYDLDTVSGQFTIAVLIVAPLEQGMYRITVNKKPQVPYFGPLLSSQIVREAQVGELVRQTAINANVACQVYQEEKGQTFISHTEERLVQIKQVIERFGNLKSSGRPPTPSITRSAAASSDS